MGIYSRQIRDLANHLYSAISKSSNLGCGQTYKLLNLHFFILFRLIELFASLHYSSTLRNAPLGFHSDIMANSVGNMGALPL
jgi:hypothetical protein